MEEARNIRILGHVSKEDLGPSSYRFPWTLFILLLYEGFGIPILDAFNCEVPVLTSNISAMKEVAGEAAELVDPDDPSSISEGIEKILRGPRGFIDRGLTRVKDFSWEKNR